jgi:hypothetical protein
MRLQHQLSEKTAPVGTLRLIEDIETRETSLSLIVINTHHFGTPRFNKIVPGCIVRGCSRVEAMLLFLGNHGLTTFVPILTSRLSRKKISNRGGSQRLSRAHIAYSASAKTDCVACIYPTTALRQCRDAAALRFKTKIINYIISLADLTSHGRHSCARHRRFPRFRSCHHTGSHGVSSVDGRVVQSSRPLSPSAEEPGR